MSPALRRRVSICLVIGLHLLAGAGYGEVVPPWEAPDEPWHMAYAEVVATGRLPVAADTYEYHQPPLYYLWPALALRILGQEGLPRAAPNPEYPGAIATVLHPVGEPGKAELRLIRAFSGLLATLTIALAWAAARSAWRRPSRPLPTRRASRRIPGADAPGARGPDADARGTLRANRAADRPPTQRRSGGSPPLDGPLVAALCAALLPQFVFITHSISNDTLASACGALAIYGLVARRPRPHAVAAIAVGLALGWLTKLNVLPLAAALPLALARWRAAYIAGGHPTTAATRQSLRTATIAVAPLAVTVAAVAAALPALHAALTASAATRSAQSGGGVDGIVELAGATVRLTTSLWARFGWLNIDLPATFYIAAGLAAALAAAGLVRRVRPGIRAKVGRRRADLPAVADPPAGIVDPWAAAVSCAAVAAAFAAAVANLFVDGQAQGRFLFPALAGLGIALAAGWESVADGRRASVLQSVVITLLVAANAVAVAWTLPGAFAGR